MQQWVGEALNYPLCLIPWPTHRSYSLGPSKNSDAVAWKHNETTLKMFGIWHKEHMLTHFSRCGRHAAEQCSVWWSNHQTTTGPEFFHDNGFLHSNQRRHFAKTCCHLLLLMYYDNCTFLTKSQMSDDTSLLGVISRYSLYSSQCGKSQRLQIPERIESLDFSIQRIDVATDWAAFHSFALLGIGMTGSLTSEQANKQGLKEKKGSRCGKNVQFHHVFPWCDSSFTTGHAACFTVHLYAVMRAECISVSTACFFCILQSNNLTWPVQTRCKWTIKC